jgi:hypothetical protein
VWDEWPEQLRVDLSHVPHAFPCDERHDDEVARAVRRLLFEGVGDLGDFGDNPARVAPRSRL